MILETDRIFMRELNQNDYFDLCKILQNPTVMYAYEGPFNEDETHSWLNRQIQRYKEYGFGLWAVILKETNTFIGQCGITMQDVNGTQVPEIGYLFHNDYWHQGYAIECAKACKDYAFNTLKVPEIFSIIRDSNIPSQNVALRNGMTYKTTIIKHFKNVIMPHFVYSITKQEYLDDKKQVNKTFNNNL